MNYTPIEESSSRRIGVVEYVSPDEIKVGLDIDAPDGIASNAGVPREFPKINGYVLIPIDSGYIVCQIEWITIERLSFPKRKGYQDFGLVDLPFPHRKMKVNPLGVLSVKQSGLFDFKRGVQTFPSVGEPVVLPTDEQVKSIIESGQKRRVKIGTSPIALNAVVSVDPDRLFGRHLAVLGNTGSGKSCSVAGLIQWSLKNAKETNSAPNARFIILDPNGEYSRVFNPEKSDYKSRLYQVSTEGNKLEVPAWFWNSSEWCSFAQASSKAQVPLLKAALRAMRNGVVAVEESHETEARRFLGILYDSLKISKNAGEPFKQFPHNKNFTDRIQQWLISINDYITKITYDLTPLSQYIERLIGGHKFVKSDKFTDYTSYTTIEIDSFTNLILQHFTAMGGTANDILQKNEDVPVKFSGETFVNYLESLAKETNSEQHIEFLLARIRAILTDARMKSIIGDNVDIDLIDWLENYIGSDGADGVPITVIDLSLVPTEIVHVITAVIARVTFEALQRYKKLSVDGKSLPTVLVMEEAHTFIKKYKDDTEDNNAANICCKVFERIAREGRKFGLGLVLSSQRPSELSQTVLSQCNTFLLHRISNDRDQELVSKLVPDNLRGLLRELPSLPSQNAILLGWASELPILVRMNDLSPSQRPHSDDPDFWNVWVGKDSEGNTVEREVDWKSIAEEWQRGSEQKQSNNINPSEFCDCDELDTEDSPF